MGWNSVYRVIGVMGWIVLINDSLSVFIVRYVYALFIMKVVRILY